MKRWWHDLPFSSDTRTTSINKILVHSYARWKFKRERRIFGVQREEDLCRALARKKISVCTRRVVSWRIEEGRKEKKKDGEKTDGKNWKRTRTRRRERDDGEPKGSGSTKKIWANKMHSYISGVCQNKWRCFVGDLFGRRLPPLAVAGQFIERSMCHN